MSFGNSEESDYDEVPPDASGMIESLRAHGYTLPTAIADIIDNSIAASSKNVWLKFQWNEGTPWVSITDDGAGMAEKELIEAMKLASKNPLEKRAPKDLGRFGLGLKTASFSQARRLTVVSKKTGGRASIRRWDLDYLAQPGINGWKLLKSPHKDTGEQIEEIANRKLKSGTVVLLERLDRLLHVASDRSDGVGEKNWYSEVQKVREHLEMVFHRFLADSSKSGIKILLNDQNLTAWDPFCSQETATTVLPDDINRDLGEKVQVKGYVLPHRDRFGGGEPSEASKLHQAAAGPSGWNAHQGFYLYRNRRLIIHGSWLGLGPGQNGWKKEEHFKLARIRLDIPNSMDQEWQIDVKKSAAIAPPALKNWLTGIAKNIRENAKEVYAHRGGRSKKSRQKNSDSQSLWRSSFRPDGSYRYYLDRKHPLVKSLESCVPTIQRKNLKSLLNILEESLPVQRIWIDSAENQSGHLKPFEGQPDKVIEECIRVFFDAYIAAGKSSAEAWAEVASFEAFQTKSAQALIGIIQE